MKMFKSYKGKILETLYRFEIPIKDFIELLSIMKKEKYMYAYFKINNGILTIKLTNKVK
jgi:hypothetical protein